MIRVLWFLGALLIAVPAVAHQKTIAYSRMLIRDSGDVEYALKIPVEDLAETLGRDGHSTLDAPEVRGAEAVLFRHFLPLVAMRSGGVPCPVEQRGIDVPEDERLYGELRFVFHCPAGAPITFDYRVFFDVDRGHVGMLEVESTGGKSRAELIIARPRWEVVTSAGGPPELRPVERTTPLLMGDISNLEKRGKAAGAAFGGWMLLIGLAISVAAAGAFFAMRATRRRSALH